MKVSISLDVLIFLFIEVFIFSKMKEVLSINQSFDLIKKYILSNLKINYHYSFF